MTLVDDGPGTDGRAGDHSSGWEHFDVHGRVSMRVESCAPTAPQLNDMFHCFRSDSPSVATAPQLVVSSRLEDIPHAADLEKTLSYTDTSVTMPGSRMQVVADEQGYRLHGDGELLTSALPLLDALMVRTGAGMFHAATIDFRRRGIAMPAAGGTGKTSTIAKFLKLDGVSFMGDDWAFLGEDGSMLGFAKPMFIKPHHRQIYPHLFEGPRKPLVPVALSRPVGHLTTVAHPLVAQYPRLAAFSRRWSPEHLMVRPERALPGGKVSTRAPLQAAVYLERFADDRPRLEERSRDWMVARMVGNWHIEMPHHAQALITALGATGVLPLERWFAQKAAVFHSGLEGIPTYVLQVPSSMSPDEASDAIVAAVCRLLGEEAQ